MLNIFNICPDIKKCIYNYLGASSLFVLSLVHKDFNNLNTFCRKDIIRDAVKNNYLTILKFITTNNKNNNNKNNKDYNNIAHFAAKYGRLEILKVYKSIDLLIIEIATKYGYLEILQEFLPVWFGCSFQILYTAHINKQYHIILWLKNNYLKVTHLTDDLLSQINIVISIDNELEKYIESFTIENSV